MKILILSFLFLFQCDKYTSIFSGLTKNYVLLHEQIESDLYEHAFHCNNDEFLIDYKQYQDAITDFYDSDTYIIRCLLNYENKNFKLSNCIKTVNPYLSTIKASDYFKESEAAMILIDNYLSNDEKSIVVTSYVEKMNYSGFKIFYEKYKNLGKNDLKKEYRNFIKTL